MKTVPEQAKAERDIRRRHWAAVMPGGIRELGSESGEVLVWFEQGSEPGLSLPLLVSPHQRVVNESHKRMGIFE
jgi:hypothetical protein